MPTAVHSCLYTYMFRASPVHRPCPNNRHKERMDRVTHYCRRSSFFFWCSHLMGQYMCKQNTVCHISLGHRGSHPTSGEHWGKCFMHAPAHAGQCGTGSSRGAWWSTCVTLDPYPLKPPDACTSLSGGLHCLWSILPACYILPSSSRLCFCTSRYL